MNALEKKIKTSQEKIAKLTAKKKPTAKDAADLAKEKIKLQKMLTPKTPTAPAPTTLQPVIEAKEKPKQTPIWHC